MDNNRDSAFIVKTLWRDVDWTSLDKTVEELRNRVYLYENGLFVPKSKHEEDEQVFINHLKRRGEGDE